MDGATSKNRAPDWSDAEDATLAETVLNKLRLGETQLKAFAEASAKLSGRTAAACGFRWNSVVRKRLKDEIEAVRGKKRNSTVSAISDTEETSEDTSPKKSRRSRNSQKVANLDTLTQLLSPERVNDMADYIQTLSANLSLFQNIRDILAEKDREINALKETNTELLAKIKKLQAFERDFNVFAERMKQNG
ncbi:hypothetical protein [Paenibacillus sp. Y412MC10]|uniref:hypothetical protein n=1 Tax=Geobacillus sp. (strain Y412MC10) TaxID=481743 RepID=UPI0011AB2D25|nr:hypothetical protein [Paenibacillus sp. Y412MC10]